MNLNTRPALSTAGIALILALVPVLSSAQYYDSIPVGPRSIAMGGTGIASARGGEAIVANPALMGRDGGSEFTLAARFRHEQRVSSADVHHGFNKADQAGPNLASLLLHLPFQDGRFTLGIAHSRPVEPVLYADDWSGGIDMISPAAAFRLNDSFRLGAAVNFWTGSLDHHVQRADSVQNPAANDELVLTPSGFRKVSSNGLNGTVGAQWTVLEYYQAHKVYLGATFRSAFDLKTDGTPPIYYVGYPVLFPNGTALGMPAAAGFGACWVIQNRVTFCADYEYSFGRDLPEILNYHPASPGDDFPPDLRQSEDSHLIRLGGEYLLNLGESAVPIRMGFGSFETPFYNEDGSRVTGESLSLGIGLENRTFRLELAYEMKDWVQLRVNPHNEFIGQYPPSATDIEINTLVAGVTVNLEELW